MKYRSCWLIFTLRSKFGSHCLIIWKCNTHASNSLGDTRQNHWAMKYRSHRPTFILRSNIWSYWPIILKYDVHTSNSLQDITQNHWTMKYRSQWPIFLLRSDSASRYYGLLHRRETPIRHYQPISEEKHCKLYRTHKFKYKHETV